MLSTEKGTQVGSSTIIPRMRWRRTRRLGGGVGMNRRIPGRIRWERVARKGKEKARKDVGTAETRRTSKGIVPKEKAKEVGKEVLAKDIPKEVTDSNVAKAFQGNKEKRKEAKEKDNLQEKVGEEKD